MRKKGVFLLLILGMFISCVWAQIPEIPLPKDAQEDARRDTFIGPMKTQIVRYTTSLSKEKITSFFQKELPKAGWKQEREGYFSKEGYKLVVQFYPSRLKKQQQQQRFMLTYFQVPTPEELSASRKDKPDLLKFMPVYPRAKQSFLWDTPRGIIASYQTLDPIQDVVFFYKSGMLNYGWMLSEETPIKQKETEKDCPECDKKNLEDLLKKFTPEQASNVKGIISTMKKRGLGVGSAGGLTFRKDNQICTINFMRYDINPVNYQPAGTPPTTISSPEELSSTSILVSYIENPALVKKPLNRRTGILAEPNNFKK